MLVAYADVSAPRANVFMLLYMRVALRLFSMAAAVIYANDPGGRTVVVYKLLARSACRIQQQGTATGLLLMCTVQLSESFIYC